MFKYVTYWDLILGPLYILFFYFIIRFIQKKYYNHDAYLQKKLMQGFWVKIIAGIFYILLIQFYYGGGDSFMYFGFGRIMHQAIILDLNNIKFLFPSSPTLFYDYVQTINIEEASQITGYMSNTENQIISRFSCAFSFLCFQNYTVTSLFFSLFSYLGIWKVFLVLYSKFKENKKELSFSFLFLPSFAIWGSGILKESVCLFALGIIANILFHFYFTKKIKILQIIWVLACSMLLLKTKSYIFYSFSLAFGMMLLLSLIKMINIFIKFFILILGIGVVVFGSTAIIENIMGDVTEELISQSQTSQKNYEDSGGSFVGTVEINPSVSGIVSSIPRLLTNVFFRPFPWEAKNIVMFFSVLESLFFAVLFFRFLILSKLIFVFKKIAKNPVFIFAFTFALFMGIIVGFTTFNFGTIIRYKIPCTPFFCFALLLLNKKTLATQKPVDKLLNTSQSLIIG